HVTNVDIPKPAGQGFDEAAKAAVLQYEFSPAEIDGKPGAIRISFTLHFVPKIVEAPPPAAPEPAPPPPPPPPPPAPTTIVGRGRRGKRGPRTPLRAAGVSTTAPPATAPGAPAVLAGVTDADGRFVVKADPGVALRVIVADPGHDPCIRD